MDLYLVTRWGNWEDSLGAEGEDTNLLVRAATPEEAGELADEALLDVPLASGGRDALIEGHVQYIRRLGEDASDGEPAVLQGPWIEFALEDGDYQSWERDGPDDGWVAAEGLPGPGPSS